jgi:hypothetical protein
MELQVHFAVSTELANDLDVMNRLRVWLFKHTQGADQEFVPHLKAKKVDSILASWSTPYLVARKRSAIQR